MSIVPIILSGGKGKRLWPISRNNFPKQFNSLFEEESLLQSTVKRIKKLKNTLDLVFVCHEDHRFLLDRQVKQVLSDEFKIILEPYSKNTAPAIVCASLFASKDANSEEIVVLILPSDHLIKDEIIFQQVIDLGFKEASKNKIVTFGIQPTEALTGYGYIKKVDRNEKGVSDIEQFIEKPSLTKAEVFLKDKSYSWNSGIYMFKPKILFSEFSNFSKEILETCKNSVEKAEIDLNFIRLDKQEFKKNPSISIDKAIMEKTENSVVIPLKSNWIDVGSWSSVHKASQQDDDKNVFLGNIHSKETKNSYIRSDTRVVACIGMDGVIIIDTPDILLVSSMRTDQSVKEIAEKLQKDTLDEGSSNEVVHRAWGTYKVIDRGEAFLVKRIIVNPRARLSLQKHRYRAEHWIVVKGKAKVTCGEKSFILTKNESTFIPIGSKHRLENTTSDLLELIEVQSGSYLSEDDIERLDDQYHR